MKYLILILLLTGCTTRKDTTYICKSEVFKQGDDIRASSTCGDARHIETEGKDVELQTVKGSISSKQKDDDS